MEHYQKIILRVLQRQIEIMADARFIFDADVIVERESYKSLWKIKSILEDENLPAAEKLQEISGIIYSFEDLDESDWDFHEENILNPPEADVQPD